MALFQTPRLLIRDLQLTDLPAFHEMQGNPAVMQYATGKVNTLKENEEDLKKVITHYKEPNNQFWVWAIERLKDQNFVGTCALIGDGKGTHEIGFRFLEKYWKQGYGKETCNALIAYASCQEEVKTVIAYVDTRNIGSIKILDQSTLTFIKEVADAEIGSTDRFYKKVMR